MNKPSETSDELLTLGPGQLHIRHHGGGRAWWRFSFSAHKMMEDPFLPGRVGLDLEGAGSFQEASKLPLEAYWR